eukprot:TRINITY_DN10252_c0_g1_i1.p1 TRINITY_DN10252_c0_g1~~TRINITY_DN10252_c0_g1_i1.p1  ORF type:complete len:402 (-),score=55.66 TRINITY_DN10252_c0_g1_i1:222-1427(-)
MLSRHLSRPLVSSRLWQSLLKCKAASLSTATMARAPAPPFRSLSSLSAFKNLLNSFQFRRYPVAVDQSTHSHSYYYAGHGRPQGWMGILVALCAANFLIFLLWWYEGFYNGLKGIRWMTDNFTCSLHNLQEGRWWTLLSSAFSQREPLHMIVNIAVIYQFGQLMSTAIGAPATLLFYLTCACVANLVHIGYSTVVQPWLYAEDAKRRVLTDPIHKTYHGSAHPLSPWPERFTPKQRQEQMVKWKEQQIRWIKANGLPVPATMLRGGQEGKQLSEEEKMAIEKQQKKAQKLTLKQKWILMKKWLHTRNPYDSPALGASGAAMGIFSVAIALAPRATIFVYFVPVPAAFAWVTLVGYDAYHAFVDHSGADRIAHGAHLGGALFGMLYYFYRFQLRNGLRFRLK